MLIRRNKWTFLSKQGKKTRTYGNGVKVELARLTAKKNYHSAIQILRLYRFTTDLTPINDYQNGIQV